MKNVALYAVAALALVVATAAMASFAAPAVLAHIDPSQPDNILLAAQMGFLF